MRLKDRTPVFPNDLNSQCSECKYINKSEGVLQAVIEAQVVRISFLVCFLFSVPPFPCDKLDLTMVLDRTESIGHNLFNKMKILAADLTDRYRGN